VFFIQDHEGLLSSACYLYAAGTRETAISSFAPAASASQRCESVAGRQKVPFLIPDSQLNAAQRKTGCQTFRFSSITWQDTRLKMIDDD